VRLLLRLAFVLLLCGSGAAGASAQIYKLPHPDTTLGNFFGAAVSIEGNRALVGASAEDVCGESSGAAYIFEREAEGETWKEVAKLTASDCAAGDFFGRSLSLSGDRALIAAAETFFNTYASNAAYIFERDSTGTWREVARLTGEYGADEGSFASSVSLDGDRALITTSGDPAGKPGAAYIYERNEQGMWAKVARLAGSGDPREGVFGGFGWLDGDRAVVTASTYYRYKPGSVYLFERNAATGTWEEVQRITGVDDFFISVDLDGDRLIVGESRGGWRGSGIVSLYVRSASGKWVLAQTIEPSYPYEYGAFGTEVALKGDYALIVGYDEQLGFSFNVDRVVYLFKHGADGKWRQVREIDVGEVAFGTAVDVGENWALIGQASEREAGSVYVINLP